MRNMTAVAMLVLAVLFLGNFGPTPLQAQNNPQSSQGQGEDMAHHTARVFAPFIRAIVMRRVNTAQQIFKLRRSVESALEQADTVRILGRFQKPDRLDLNLIGGRTLGQNIGILLFTVATEDGPVCFKIFYYGFGQDINISRIEISDDWDTIESNSSNIDLLGAPITVSLSGQIDEGGGGQ